VIHDITVIIIVMSISIISLSPLLQSQAQAIAKQYHFDYIEATGLKPHTRFQLQLSEHNLQLVDFNNTTFGPLTINFITGKTAHRRLYGGGKSQLLAKAVGLNKGFKPHLIDATTGLAQDSFVLACLGCKVTMLERSPVLAAMLNNALQHAREVSEISAIVTSMQLIHTDSIEQLCATKLENEPDIIYLDPMFPEKKSHALVKKEMQYLQHLVGKDIDSSQLLSCAIKQAKYRVVVKRPAKAPYLDGQKPQLELGSKKQRFDIYINQKLPIN
jgi:16S rRNA (guanine1516-N2)-methyltransferase